jgi:exodeoxyribonuclease VII large subunit
MEKLMSLDEESQFEPRGHAADRPLSISQLNWYIKNLLEQSMPSLWAEGEVSDLSRPSSGHLYFTLKDQQSQIRAVIWRSAAQRVPFKIEDGMSIVCCGGVEVYPPRGTYQLIISKLQPQGIGPLQLAFQQLHQKLKAEGLFDEERKKPLPKFPRRIGFVTSPSGAALHDFIEAARRRWPDFELIVIPARVQGDQAAGEIVRGIRMACRFPEPLDLLIVGRGGGSLEDLWCFNEESVVRELSRCNLPTISAVGHEIDVTLSDLVADARALTPTHAAQLALPDREELVNCLEQWRHRTHQAARLRIKNASQRIDYLAERSVLAQPHNLHIQRRQRVDDWELKARIAIWNLLRSRKDQMQTLTRATAALSPLNVLARGYSLTQSSTNQRPIRSWQEVELDDEITTTLADGSLQCRVIQRRPASGSRPE